MMHTRPLTKADLIAAINKALKFTAIELPHDVKDHAKSERIQIEARDMLNRARSGSIAVIVLDMPKEKW